MTKILGTTGDDSFDGTSADDQIQTFEGDDFVSGGAGDDYIVTNEGADTVLGGAGSDRIFGCEDDDILDGGAGQDFINAGTGNDRLIFTQAENLNNAVDYYGGFEGIDTLVLNLTSAEFAAAENDIQAFLRYIEQTTDGSGESDGPFFRFQTLNLAVNGVENVEVRIADDIVFTTAQVANADTVTTSANASVAGDVSTNDVANAGASFTLLSGVSAGTLVLDGNGGFTFDPGSEFVGLGNGETATQSFTYQIADGANTPVSATATVTITGVNDAPVVTAISQSQSEDAAGFVVDLLAGSVDPDTNDTLSIAGVNVTGAAPLPAGALGAASAPGTLANTALDGSELTVDLDAFQSLAIGEARTLTVTYSVTDGTLSTTNTASLTITGENDAPVLAAPLTLSLADGDSASSFDLLAGASDVDASDVLAVTGFAVTSGNAAGLTLNGNSVDIDPSAYAALGAGESETVQASFVVTDGNGGTAAQTVAFTITGTNDAPTVAAALSETLSDTGSAASIDLLDGASDINVNDTLAVAGFAVTSGDGSGVSVSGNSVDIDPSAYTALGAGESEVITTSYTIEDGNGGSVAQTATFTITGTNDAPTVAAALSEILSDTDASTNFSLLTGANDINVNDTLTVSNFSVFSQTGGNNSGILFNGDNVDIVPSAYAELGVGESEIIVASYTIEDGNGGSVAQTATFTITGTNDAPTVAAPIMLTLSETDTVQLLDLLAGASDINVNDVLDITAPTLVSGNAVGIMPSGAAGLSVDPAAYAALLDAGDTEFIVLSYDVIDGNGGAAAQTATITILGAGGTPPINNAPVDSGPNSVTVVEDSGIIMIDPLATITDADGDPLTINIVLPLPPGVSFNTASQMFEIDTSDAAFQPLAQGGSQDYNIIFDVSDGNGGLISTSTLVTVQGVNDAPTTTGAILLSFTESDPITFFDLLANASDIDLGDTLTAGAVTLISGDDSGFDSATGTLGVQPSLYASLSDGESEVVTFAVDINDAFGGTVTQEFIVTIIGQGAPNSAPVLTGPNVSSFDEDGSPGVVNLLSNVTDVDGDALTVMNVSTLPSGVTFAVIDTMLSNNLLNVDTTDSSFQELSVNEVRDLIISYDVADGNGGMVSATATINVIGTNDAPTALAPVNFTFDTGDAPFALNLLTNVDDVDLLDVLAAAPVTVTSGFGGGFSQTGSTLTFDPTDFDAAVAAAGGTLDLTYTSVISDGNGGTALQTYNLTVTDTGGNAAPNILDGLNADLTEDGALATFDLTDFVEDDEGDPLRAILTSVLPDGFSFNPSTSELTIDPSDTSLQNLALGEMRTFDVDYDITDDQGNFVPRTSQFTFTGTNDAPVVAAVVTRAATEDQVPPLFINLLEGASDVDVGDTLTASFNPTDLPQGMAASGANGVTFDPADPAYQNIAAGDTRDVVFNYVINDSNGGSVPQSLTITVTGTNDAPTVAAAFTDSITEGSDFVIGINPLDGASDLDIGDTLTAVFPAMLPPGFFADTAGVTFDARDPAYDDLSVGDSVDVVLDYTIEDGNGGSVAQSITITVIGTNDVPIVSAPVMGSVTEAALVDDGTGTLTSDIPFNLLEGASDVDTGDILTAANHSVLPPGTSLAGPNVLIVDSLNPAFDSLNVGETVDLTINYDVTDGNGGVTPQTITITVTGTNDAPVVSAPVTFVTNEDNDALPVLVDLLGNVTDVDNDLADFSISNVAGLAAGLTFATGGAVLNVFPATFDSLAMGETFNTLITYDVTDGQGGVVNHSADITIEGRNDAPTVSSAINLSFTEDDSTAPVEIDLLQFANDVDLSDTLSITNVTSAGDGVSYTIGDTSAFLDLTIGAFQALNDGLEETVEITYDIEDSNGGVVSQAAVITITGVNDAPEASGPILITMSEDDFPVSVPDSAFLLDNITDVDNNVSSELTVSNVISSGVGLFYDAGSSPLTVELRSYLPVFQALAVGETTTETLTFDVNDANGGTVAHSVVMTIEGRNDGPTVAGPLSQTTSETTPVAGATLDLLTGASDVDTSDVLNVLSFTTLAGDASGLTLVGNTIQVDGSAYAALNNGESEVISIEYDIIDGNGGVASQSATITVEGFSVNQAPVSNEAAQINGDEGLDNFPNAVASQGASDPDGDTLTVVPGSFGTLPSWLFFNPTNQRFSVDELDPFFDPIREGETFFTELDYTLSDGNGGTVGHSLSIFINGENDRPVVAAPLTLATQEDFTLDFLNLLDGASDVDNQDIISIQNVRLDVPDFGLSSIPPLPAFFIDPVTGAMDIETIDSSLDFLRGGEFTDFIFTYSIIDLFGSSRTQTATVTIEGFNDAPVIEQFNVAVIQTEDTVQGYNVLAGIDDPDGDDANLVITGISQISGPTTGPTVGINPTTGDIIVNSSSFGVTLPTDFTYQYTVQDEGGATSTGQFSVRIFPGVGNTAPTAGPMITDSVSENSLISYDLLAGASDPDTGDALSIGQIFGLGDFLQFDLATNSVSLNSFAANELAQGETRIANFGYFIEDGRGGRVFNNALITINGENDAPETFEQPAFFANEDDGIVAFDLLQGSFDVDRNSVLEVTSLTNADGLVSFTVVNDLLAINLAESSIYQSLTDGETGVFNISYLVEDSSGASVPQTGTVTISGANDVVIATESLLNFTDVDDVFSSTLGFTSSDADASDVQTVTNVVQTSGTSSEFDFTGGVFTFDPEQFDLGLGDGQIELLTFDATITSGPDTITSEFTIEIAGTGSGSQQPISPKDEILAVSEVKDGVITTTWVQPERLSDFENMTAEADGHKAADISVVGEVLDVDELSEVAFDHVDMDWVF